MYIYSGIISTLYIIQVVNSILNSKCMYKGCNITINTLPIHFFPTICLSATTFYKDHICQKRILNNCLWFLSTLDLLWAKQSIQLYMDIQIRVHVIKYNDSYIDFMCWEEGVCEKPNSTSVGEVHTSANTCVYYSYSVHVNVEKI